MKITRWMWMGVLILALCAPAAFGQAKVTGEIAGTAVTENGESLPGVNVVLTGEKLFQKQLTAVTNEKGIFRFLHLNPGKYEIEFSLSGFDTVKITNVVVSIGQTTPAKAAMIQATLQSEVIVRSQAPLIETKNVQISTNFTTDMVAQLPTQRNVQELMESTPGINEKGAYGAGGIVASGKDSPFEYTTGSSTSGFLFNGVDVSDLASGNSWVNPNYDTVDEIQIVGVGASAEYGNFSGAVLNVITKAGSNKTHGGLSFYYTDSSLQRDNSKGIPDLKPREIKYSPEASASFGGPLIREKLFFFLAGGYTGLKDRKYGDPAYGILKQPRLQGRLDWVPGPKHQLSFVINSDPLDHDNLGLKFGSGTEIGYANTFRTTVWNANWQFLMSANSFLSLKYAGFRGSMDTVPNESDAVSIRDRVNNSVYGSSGTISNDSRVRDQVNANLTHYADNFLGASHEFKFGVEYERSVADSYETATGQDPDGLVKITVIPFGPMYAAYGWTGYTFHWKPQVDRIAGFVQDNIQIGKKLNVNLGVRYDHATLKALNVGKVTEFKNFAPRLGLTYDITGDAQNVLRASYGRYFDKTVTTGFLYAFQSGVERITAYLGFFPGAFEPTAENIANLGKKIRDMNTPILSVDPSVPYPVDQDITSPYTDVFNIGFKKALGRAWALDLDYIYKQDRNFIGIQTRTPHTYAQRQYTDPELPTSTITIWDQLDTTPDQWYYGNSKFMKRRHHLAMLTLRKLPSANWSMMGSIVYQDSRGNVDNTTGPVDQSLFGLDTDPQFTENPLMWGKLTYNHTWQFKLLGTYQLPWGINMSGIFRALSGYNWAPYQNLYMTGPANREGLFKTYLEKRGSRQAPWNVFLDLRLAKSFHLGGSRALELMADVFNLLNKDNWKYFSTFPGGNYTIAGTDAFGKATELYSPFGARFGLRVTF